MLYTYRYSYNYVQSLSLHVFSINAYNNFFAYHLTLFKLLINFRDYGILCIVYIVRVVVTI